MSKAHLKLTMSVVFVLILLFAGHSTYAASTDSLGNTRTGVSVTSSSLRLGYDASRHEGNLIALVNGSITTGATPLALSNYNPFLVQFKTGGSVVYPNSYSSTYTIDRPLNDNTIPAYTTVHFSVTTSGHASELFAGNYTATLAWVIDRNANLIAVPRNETNMVAVIGETSPYINSVSPQVHVGDTAKVTGVRLNVSQVLFDDSDSGIGFTYNSTNTILTFVVPSSLPAGTHMLSLRSASTGLSNRVPFTVLGNGAVPRISFLSSFSGAVGSRLTISGSGFAPMTHVRFRNGVTNGLTLDVPSANGTSLSFAIPRSSDLGLGQNEIAVTNDNYTFSNPINFIVLSGNPTGSPVISSLDPSSGPVGSPIEITASGQIVNGLFYPVLTDGGCSPEMVAIHFSPVTGRPLFNVPVSYPCSNGNHSVVSGNYIFQGWDSFNNHMSNAVNFAVGSAATSTSGIYVDNVSSTEESSDNGTATSSDDYGIYKITFDVSAMHHDQWIELSTERSLNPTAKGVDYTIENSANTTVTAGTINGASLEQVSGGSLVGNFVKINNGSTARLRLSVYYNPASSGAYRVQMNYVGFNGWQGAANANQHLIPAENYDSGLLFVNDRPAPQPPTTPAGNSKDNVKALSPSVRSSSSDQTTIKASVSSKAEVSDAGLFQPFDVILSKTMAAQTASINNAIDTILDYLKGLAL